MAWVSLVLVVWASYMSVTQRWGLFLASGHTDTYHWHISVMMAFGSFIAGSTSEGGGAIAYPFMTLFFKIESDIARNFSLAIQSVGMVSAAIFIVCRSIPIEKTYLALCAAGGVFGMVIGSFALVPLVSPVYVKMLFVSLWLSFGVVMFYENFIRKDRRVRERLPVLTVAERLTLVGIGFLGGVISSLTGSGIDIATFSYVTSRYQLSEKVATPTSVCLMASNTVIGFLLHAFVIGDFFDTPAFSYWLVAIPVVLFGAPLGAFFISTRTREFAAKLLYVLLAMQFVFAVYVVRPSGQLLAFTMLVFVAGLLIFGAPAVALRAGARSGGALKLPE